MTKNEIRSSRSTVALLLSLVLAVPGLAVAEKGGKGGGKGGGGGGGGGGSDITPAKITFASSRGMGELGDRIDSDGGGTYVHGQDGLEVYLGAGGAHGDIFFLLGNATNRGLWLDFSVCARIDPLDCNPPNPALGVDYDTSIAVAPGDAVPSGDGLFGIAAGDTIYAPVEIFYAYTGEQHPGKVFFDPGLKGKNPCKNLSLNVAIYRPGPEERWIVSADDATPACATLPGGGGNDLSGQYDMTFSFTIETLP